MAKKIGTSRQEIYKLRKGLTRVLPDWAKRLAPHLGVSWDELIDGSQASTSTDGDEAPSGLDPSAYETRQAFAVALRIARLGYGRETNQGELTQKEFAQMLGISGERPEERYRLYESAQREPPLWILTSFRRVTGYSLDDLIAQLPAGRRLPRG
jgi:transcriptional regulator with XRE-family HTH domain